MTLRTTPSQTVGPFFAHALPWPDGNRVVAEGRPGAFRVSGVVRDGNGEPVPDALVETWQADPEGRFPHPADPRRVATGFRGFGRCATDERGGYEIWTVKPGRVPGPDGRAQAPHIAVSVFARGLLQRVITRLYFADETAANAQDAVLGLLDEQRRSTLLAAPHEGGYRFDVHLQGPDETAFFAV